MLGGFMIGKRVPIVEAQINDALESVRLALLRRIKEKGDLSFASTHEALGIIDEEHHELTEAVRSNSHRRFENECMDIAVACVFAIACKRAGTLDW